MSALTQAFYDVLSGDATLTALLGTYQSAPSVFTKIPLPPDFDIAANGPYILSVGEVTVTPGPTDTKNSAGETIERDVRCYADLALSPDTVETIARRAKTLFHRQPIAVAGFDTVIADVNGPIAADDEDALGRVVSVVLTLAES